ncbi:MAG: AsmA family protein [Acidobacteriaceae bacterium]|nr:AsmA family protein [Acidobacteriaceae bacterium]
MRRTVVIIVAAVVVLVVIALLVVSSNVDRYRPRVQAELEKKLDRKVTLGQLGLKLFPLSLAVSDVTISENPAFGTNQPFATAKKLYVSVGFFSLLTGNPQVKEISLDHPQVELIRDAKGVWNVSTIGGAGKTSAPSAGASNSSNDLTLDELKITDGTVAITDQAAQRSRAVYNHIDVDLSGFGPNKQFGLDLAAHLPGNGKEVVEFRGKVGPLVPGNSALVPVNGRLSLQEVGISGLNALVPGGIPDLNDGVASGSADISSQQQLLSAKGNLKLENAVLRGTKLNYPIEAEYDISDNRSSDLIQIRSGNVKLGQTSFAISGSMNAGTKPATINAHLTTRDSSITELAQLAGSFGVAFNPAYQVKGNVTADVTATGSANDPQLSGSLAAKGLSISGGEIKQPVSVPAVSLALTPDTVRTTSPFTAQSGATSVTTAFSLQHYTTKDMSVDATLQTKDANISELLNMAKAYGIQSIQGMTGSGKLSLDVHVQGPVSDTAKLTYAGTGNISGATLSTPELTKPVNLTSANIRFAQNSAAIDNLKGSVGTTTVSGNLSASNFAAPQLQFALSADKIDTAELEGLTKAPPAPANKATSAPQKRAQPQPSLLSKTTGSGTLAVNSLRAQDMLLTNVHANCKLDRGVIQLSPITAGVYGGSENGTITLDTRPASPQCSVNAKLAGVDTNALLSAVSSVKNTLYGSLAADANLAFTVASSNELARTLNGTVAFNVANGELKNVNIMNEVSKLGKFLNAAPSKSGNATALKKLSGTLTIRNGVASTNNLIASLEEGSLSGSGSLNLADQTINMHVNAILSSGTSQAVGGNHIGGFMNTALANNKGELVVPVLVTGSLAHPAFAPDVEAMAKMKVNNLLPSVADPGKLVGGALGKGGAGQVVNGILGGGQQQSGQPASKNTNDTINSILKGFGKKKDTQH